MSDYAKLMPMKSFVRLLSGVLVQLIGTIVFANDGSALTNSGTLTTKDVPYNRSLPHAFYDQALASLPHLYPNHRLVVGRRTGVVGDVEYALICFLETSASEHSVIEAVAVFQERASYVKKISTTSCDETLVDILNYLAMLPSNASARRSAANVTNGGALPSGIR